MEDIDRIRKKIDAIDDRILELLNSRAEKVIEIGHIKRGARQSFYRPEREMEILRRLRASNKGPFPSEALGPIYREILSASLSLEEPLKISCLGPVGTYSHLAALKHFGSSSSFLPVDGINRVFESVEAGKAEYGVVPIENSNEGVVSHTLDMFMDSDLTVVAEISLAISHNLLSRQTDLRKIKRVYSHPQALAQCRGWLEKNLPGVPTSECSSTSKAAETASKDKTSAAIAGDMAASMYDLYVVEKGIEDGKNNITRFLVVSKHAAPRTGNDKTSIMFSIKDRPGSLYDILLPFKRARINLTRIESRPSKRRAWEYIFFVDLQGHMDDKKIAKAVEAVREGCLYLKILGSYQQGSVQ